MHDHNRGRYWVSWGLGLVVAAACVAVNWTLNTVEKRADLTEDKRYTLPEPLLKIAEKLDKNEPVKITVYLSENLPQVVAHHLHPPVAYPEGWDAPLSDLARCGIEEFNHGEYFEQHELLEQAWLTEPRPIREMYQGILQVGVAFLQIQRNNWAGAVKMFRRGLPRLRTLPPICQGVDIAAFRASAEAIHWEVTDLGAARLGEFDQARFPHIVIQTQA